MELKGDNGNGKAWCSVLFKKKFKGGGGTKIERHYNISVPGYDIKDCIVTIPPSMMCQLKIS